MSGASDQSFFAECKGRLCDPQRSGSLWRPAGRVRAWVGIAIEGEGLVDARVGSLCRIETDRGAVAAEVAGFRHGSFILMPLETHRGVAPGNRIFVETQQSEAPAGDGVLGRVLDGLGRPLDGKGPIPASRWVPLERSGEPALRRERIREPFDVGVRAINALCPLGRGARMGIFAGSGVGKSTLLGQIAQHARADINVIALVGERGREVREFLERDLGAARSRSVVVVATSDEAPLLRVRAARMATAIAEAFRERGSNVLLMMDSLTRFCNAQREIGLAAGEPPATRGYPPSVWSLLPRLLERAGTSTGGGSITGLYTVLVEGDDLREPVADAARSMLDGHISLSRELAEAGHFPSIDVLASVSRVMSDVVSPEHVELARRARAALACYRDARDLLSIGAYRAGTDPQIDEACRVREPLNQFLRQRPDESSGYRESQDALALALANPTAVNTTRIAVPPGSPAPPVPSVPSVPQDGRGA